MHSPGLAAAAGLAVLVLVASCTSEPQAAAPVSRTSSPPVATSTAPSAVADQGVVQFSCESPIGQLVAPTRPQRVVLDAVALDTSKSLQANDAGGTAPHRLFAKTPLMVHVGRSAEIVVPTRWASRASVTWGNRASEWTTQLRIPACPSSGPGGDWLVYPGGLSVDQPSCVPLEIHAGGTVATVRMSVGAPC